MTKQEARRQLERALTDNMTAFATHLPDYRRGDVDKAKVDIRRAVDTARGGGVDDIEIELTLRDYSIPKSAIGV